MNEQERKQDNMSRADLTALALEELQGMARGLVARINERKGFHGSTERLYLEIDGDKARIQFANSENEPWPYSWALGPKWYDLSMVTHRWLDAYAEAQKQTWQEARYKFQPVPENEAMFSAQDRLATANGLLANLGAQFQLAFDIGNDTAEHDPSVKGKTRPKSVDAQGLLLQWESYHPGWMTWQEAMIWAYGARWGLSHATTLHEYVMEADAGQIEAARKVEIYNYLRRGKKKKWASVVVFLTEPKDSPRTSKECIELAKYTHEGDAWNYALRLSAHPGSYAKAWGIVIR